MKILMLTDFYPPILGGMERHVQSLSNGLSQRDYQVTVCTIGLPGLPRYEEEGEVKIHRVEGLLQRIPFVYKDRARQFHPPTQDWLISRELEQIMKRERPDVIHAHGWILYSILGMRFKVPLVATLHDYGLLCPKRTLLNKDSICDEPLTRDCIDCDREFYGLIKSLSTYWSLKRNVNKLKSVDRFIAVSSFVREIHTKHLGLSEMDIVTIPNFYDADIDEQREQMVDFPSDFILFVGAISPHKGVNVLFDAYQKLNTQTKLVLIGCTHPDYPYKKTESIMVLENAPHNVVMQAMSRCKFTVFPSIWPDPCPTVTFEAMSQKKAIIASAVGGFIDIVVEGKTGILVPPDDSKKLAEAIAQLLQRPEIAIEMGESGYDRFLKYYTPDAVIPSIVDVYKSVI